MNARLVRFLVAATFTVGFVVLVVTTADLVHLLHASLLLALGVGTLLSRPRTG
jgi:NADH:ubiquinone oxidoreductase subunit 6 (subunit J)